MSLEYVLVMIFVSVAGGVLSTIISDQIKGYTNLTTLKKVFSFFKISHLTRRNNIVNTGDNVYIVQSPHQNNDSVKYKFSSGGAMSFSLKSISQNYSDQDYFVSEMKKANQHLVDRGDVTDNDLLLILEEVWKKAFA